MSYQVIARKYRPQRFADVVGQEHVTQTLSNAIAQKRIAHAYLFVGPRGTGKTTIARIFAKCLNCTDGPRVDFPEDDPRAREIAEGRALDVLEIDGASNRGIEEIRELRETVKYAPATSKFKIYIIDEVHMLTKEAFNALLKTLEEPPAHVKFMFATTEPEKVLPTILSRCQRFDLRRIPSALIVKHLGEIAQKEGIKIDPAALHAVARGAEGGMRDAESTLDQLISFCGQTITEEDVLSMFGLTAQAQIMSLAHSVLAGQGEKALRELDQLCRHGKDLGRLLGDLLIHFRNILIFLVSKGDIGLLEISESELRGIEEQAASTTSEAVTRVMDVLADCENKLREAASKKILVEVSLLKAMEARSAVSIDTVIQRLNELRSEAAGHTPAPQRQPPSPGHPNVAGSTPANASAKSVSPPRPASTSPAISALDATADLEQIWARLVDAVGKASPFAKTYLLEAHPVSMAKNVFTIGFDPEFADHLGLVDNSKNHLLLQAKLTELGYQGYQVKFVQAPAPPNRARLASVESTAPVPPSTPPPEPASPPGAGAPVKPPKESPGKPKAESIPFTKEDFKNDPLIQKALEVFKGQIIDVRS